MTEQEKMRAAFEHEVFSKHFWAHVQFKPGQQFADTTGQLSQAELCAKDADGNYVREDVSAMWFGCQFANAHSAETIARLEKVAAAAQSDNVRLRDALRNALSCGSPFWTDDAQLLCLEQGREALAQSLDTSALDAYVRKNYVVRHMRLNSQNWTSKEWAAFGVMADECRSSQLYKDGDAILVWVNKWDICRIGQMIEPDKQGE